MAELRKHASLLPKPSRWVVGGDRWAFDVGASGVHHVMASGEDLNILILDTDTHDPADDADAAAQRAPLGLSVAPSKKDLGLYAMSYGGVYVASIRQAAFQPLPLPPPPPPLISAPPLSRGGALAI